MFELVKLGDGQFLSANCLIMGHY